jgi:hypothetical protein
MKKAPRQQVRSSVGENSDMTVWSYVCKPFGSYVCKPFSYLSSSIKRMPNSLLTLLNLFAYLTTVATYIHRLEGALLIQPISNPPTFVASNFLFPARPPWGSETNLVCHTQGDIQVWFRWNDERMGEKFSLDTTLLWACPSSCRLL